VVPESARLAVGRFFRNLLMPVRFANNLLQLKLQRAGTELARFALNSTIGVLGFGDPAAKDFALQAYPEDFGQTLGHYGVGSGFHIVLPLLGPSNLRDTVGLLPDYYLDPVNYIEGFETRLAVHVYDQVNNTSLHLGEYESLKKDAVDLYTFLRDGYEQHRDQEIKE
jgi:phospholipid-binding lipoprotein MlaA